MSDLITGGSGYRPVYAADPIGGAAKHLSSSKVDEFLGNAKKFLGQWYLWGGGHSSKTGLQRVDCSGLVLQAARLSGLNLDGTAASQQNMGVPVSMKDLKPGDLVFAGKPAHHVGIYLGDNKVIHAPHTGAKVQIVDLSTYHTFDNAVRVFDGAPTAEAPKPAEEAAPAPAADTFTPSPEAAQAQVAAVAAPAPAPGPAYVVKQGESLWMIAERTLGDRNRWREIFELNKAAMANNPNLAFPGATLVLPAGATVPAAPATPAPAVAAAPAAQSAGATKAAPVGQLWLGLKGQLGSAAMRVDNAIANAVPSLQSVMASMTGRA